MLCPYFYRGSYPHRACLLSARVVTVGLEIFHNGRWICLPRTDDNFFLVGSRNKIEFPLRVRLTSVSGERVESTITELKNDVDLTSSVQFSGFIKGRSHIKYNLCCSRSRVRVYAQIVRIVILLKLS